MVSLDQIFNQAIQNRLEFTRVDQVTDQTLFDTVTQLGIKSQELLIVLEELLMNSIEHGGDRPNLSVDASSSHFTILLIDEGAGIHTQVPKNPRLSDTQGKTTTSILRLALEEGISGTGTLGRGMGLFYLSKFVSDHNAESLVASDRGYVMQQGRKFYEQTTTRDIKGTTIIIRVAKSEVGA